MISSLYSIVNSAIYKDFYINKPYREITHLFENHQDYNVLFWDKTVHLLPKNYISKQILKITTRNRFRNKIALRFLQYFFNEINLLTFKFFILKYIFKV